MPVMEAKDERCKERLRLPDSPFPVRRSALTERIGERRRRSGERREERGE